MNKNLDLLREQKIPPNTLTYKQADLNNSLTKVEDNKIYPFTDDSKFKFGVDYYNYFVNKIPIRKQAQLRRELWDLFKKCYFEIYKSELSKASIKRYLVALSNIWANNPELGIQVIKVDPSKNNSDKFTAPHKNSFSFMKAIKKLRSVNIEDLDKYKDQITLKTYQNDKKI